MNDRPSAPGVATLVAADPVGGHASSSGSASAAAPSGGMPAQSDKYLGRTLDGRYVIERQLGEGGMGVVYGGRHKLIEKRVAIKVLRGDMAADHEMTNRFLNEARAASSIGNPHIVDISDFGKLDDGATYFVMEFLDGKSLAALMAELVVVPVPRLVAIAKQIARGLAAAHEAGIVHRDLKPDNVMLVSRGGDPDFVKILDFGIAKVSGESGRLTRAGSVFGTPHYMSPEQAAGVPVDQRTDIYSLGIILYEMAAGRVPFDADNFMGILTQHMYKAPAPIRALVPQAQEVPAGLEAIVLKCLSKKVELRYASMGELLADLEALERGLLPQAVPDLMGRSAGFNAPADYFKASRPPPAFMPGSPPRPRKRTLFWAGIAGAAIAATVVVGGVVAASLGMASTGADPANARAADPVASQASADPSPASSSDGVPAPATTPVQIVATPLDAVVRLDGTELGPQPQTIELSPGDQIEVEVARSGYVTGRVTIDGSSKRVEVKLDRVAAPTATKRKTAPKATAAKTASKATAAKAAPKATAAKTARPKATAAKTARPKATATAKSAHRCKVGERWNGWECEEAL